MISVMTVVCNEEEMLPRWLSHYQFAERTVFVDGNSRDATEMIARDAGVTVFPIVFPSSWCEDTRTQKVHEWYRGLKSNYAIVTDVDEYVEPLDRLFWYADHFPAGKDVVIGRAVNCCSPTEGVFPVENPTKPVLMKTGVENLQLSWACHQIYGTRNHHVDDVFMCHRHFEDFQLAYKRWKMRPYVPGKTGDHWFPNEEKFVNRWNEMHSKKARFM